MKKPKKTQKKVTMDSLKELGRKYGVPVTDMSKRGIRAIGVSGGVRKQHHRAEKEGFKSAIQRSFK
jgi:hypothetical protein